MTTSCTRALDLAGLTIDIQPGDEIITSSYNYVGAATAFANYGARMVFVDIEPGTMNINVALIEEAISEKTKAIMAMHYAAYPCDIAAIREICDRRGIVLIEDNAQGIQAFNGKRRLGTYGDFSCMSFDMLKNISCHEGGLLLCKEQFADKVDIHYENGTNRMAFMQKKTTKYEWVDRGSKFLMSEHVAAILHPLLLLSEEVCRVRRSHWDNLYSQLRAHAGIASYLPQPLLDFPGHNGHIAFLKMESSERRQWLTAQLKEKGIPSAFHYVPLHASPAGRKFGKVVRPNVNTERESMSLLRLPMHYYLTEDQVDHMASSIISLLMD